MPERQFERAAALAHEHKRALWLYRAQNAIWLWLGLAALLSFFQYLYPDSYSQTAIDRELSGAVAFGWHSGFALSGLFLIFGIWHYAPRIEIAGHFILSAAALVNATAVVTLAGPGPNFWILVAIVIASLWRAWFLWSVTPNR